MKAQLTILLIFTLFLIMPVSSQTSGFTYGSPSSNSIVKLYTSSIYNGNVTYVNNFNQILNTTSNVSFAQVISNNLCYSNGTNCMSSSGIYSYNHTTVAINLLNNTYGALWYNMTVSSAGMDYTNLVMSNISNNISNDLSFDEGTGRIVFRDTDTTEVGFIKYSDPEFQINMPRDWVLTAGEGNQFNFDQPVCINGNCYTSLMTEQIYNHTIASNLTIFNSYDSRWSTTFNNTYSVYSYNHTTAAINLLNNTYGSLWYNYSTVKLTTQQTSQANISNVAAINFTNNDCYITTNSTCIMLMCGGTLDGTCK